MLVIPAIDLKGGKCVRLVEGKLGTERVYSDDPAEQAREFVALGAERIHVVDLDGAFRGHPENDAAILAIVDATDRVAQAVRIPVFASGGVAGLEDIERLRPTAVAGVVVGRALYEGQLNLVEALKVMKQRA